MNAYLMGYYKTGSYGYWKQKEVLTVANTPEEALGLTLDAHPDTQAKDWSTVVVDLSKPEAIQIWEGEAG